MRGTKARAIRKAQRVCDHQSNHRHAPHPKTVQWPKCVKCGVSMGASAPDGELPF